MFSTKSDEKKKEDFRFTSLARDREVVPEHEGALRPNFVAVNSIQMLRPKTGRVKEVNSRIRTEQSD